MSNLRKVLRALNHCEEWREMIEAAAMIVGKEITRDLQVQTTFTLADQIVFNEDTLEVDVSGVEDGDVLQAVADFEEAAEKAGQNLAEDMPASMVTTIVVGNDPWWEQRVRTMCELTDKPYSDLLLKFVTENLAAQFWVTEEYSILGNSIDDNKLKSVVATQSAKVQERVEPEPSAVEVLSAQIQALTERVDTLTEGAWVEEKTAILEAPPYAYN